MKTQQFTETEEEREIKNRDRIIKNRQIGIDLNLGDEMLDERLHI